MNNNGIDDHDLFDVLPESRNEKTEEELIKYIENLKNNPMSMECTCSYYDVSTKSVYKYCKLCEAQIELEKLRKNR